MSAQKGTPVNFAFGSGAGIGTVSTPSATLAGMLVQSMEHGAESELASVRDGDGVTVTDVYYDPRFTAQLVWKVSGSSLAGALANTSLTNIIPGTIITIAACVSRPDLVQTNWIVTEGGPKVSGGNTDIAEITMPLRRRVGITSTAT